MLDFIINLIKQRLTNSIIGGEKRYRVPKEAGLQNAKII